jgi:hypothetical protein
MKVQLVKPVPLDALEQLRAFEAALQARLDAVRAEREAAEDKRKKAPTEPQGQVEELSLDFNLLTGSDVEFCERQATHAKGVAVQMLVADREFFMQVAAKLSGVPRSVLAGLNGFDYVNVTQAVQNFFMTGSDE